MRPLKGLAASTGQRRPAQQRLEPEPFRAAGQVPTMGKIPQHFIDDLIARLGARGEARLGTAGRV